MSIQLRIIIAFALLVAISISPLAAKMRVDVETVNIRVSEGTTLQLRSLAGWTMDRIRLVGPTLVVAGCGRRTVCKPKVEIDADKI